jgi:hypothetical protein
MVPRIPSAEDPPERVFPSTLPNSVSSPSKRDTFPRRSGFVETIQSAFDSAPAIVFQSIALDFVEVHQFLGMSSS